MGSSPTTVRWCLGLQSQGLRPLTGTETIQLERQARLVLTRLLKLLIPIVASPLALFGMTLLFGGAPDAQMTWYRLVPALLLLAAGGLILPAAALLMARDVLREWRAIRVDLGAGTIEQFRAPEPEETSETSEASETPVTVPAVTDDRTRIDSVDVVPSSKHVLLLNGQPPDRPLTAQIYESAPPPGKVALFSLPSAIAEHLPDGANGDGRIDRRRLTGEEVIELASLTRRLRRGSWLPFGFQAWVAMIGTAGVAGVLKREDLPAQWPSALLFTFLMVSGIIGLRRMVQRWRLSRILDEDARDAWVLVLHGRSTGPSPIEVLPRSQLLWSSAASPGAWRMTAVRGRRVNPPIA